MNLNLTQSELKEQIFYSEITGEFLWLITKGRNAKAGEKAGGIHPNGYRYIRVNGLTYAAHRLAWLYSTGCWPNSHIDHINGQKSDNRISNIREATRSENMRNRGIPKNNTSGFVGVHFNKRQGTFTAHSRAGGKKVHLGTFTNALDASIAYQTYAKNTYQSFFKETV